LNTHIALVENLQLCVGKLQFSAPIFFYSRRLRQLPVAENC